MPIIDTHQHLWDLKRFKLPWVEEGSILNRNYLLDDYAEATKGLNVVKTVYMEVDVTPEQQVAEAEFVTELCKQKGSLMAGAVISGRPASDGFAAYMARFKENHYIKGVRQVLHVPGTPAGFCLQKSFIQSMHLLGKMGKSYDICIRSVDLQDAVKLTAAAPDTQFILDHCGNESIRNKDHGPWKKDIERLARHKNVACKVSGIVASAMSREWTNDDLAPIINHVLDSFGPDRVVFGGDWPVCLLGASYQKWVESLKEIISTRPASDQKKLLHDNALKIYRLAEPV